MQRDDERNQNQIIRKDARNCFVESKNDCFHIGKAHLEFAAYDTAREQGSRYTGHVHIYVGMDEFLELTNEALNGYLHTQMANVKKHIADTAAPLYESLGGTPANKLKEPRADGMSLSRSIKLFVGKKQDYLLRAESGPGETDAKGLIVPRYGTKPEQQVSVAMSWRDLTQLLLMTKTHYEAWLTAQYTRECAQKPNGNMNGKVDGSKDGKNVADDTRMVT